MGSVVKTACLGLVFLFILISSLFAEPISDDEFPLDDNFLFFEEFFIFEKLLPDENFLLDNEILLNEESIPDEEFFLDDDTSAFEAPALIIEVPVFETRSFYQIFPSLSRIQKAGAMSEDGLRYYFQNDGSPSLLPDPSSGIDILKMVMEKKPSHIIEALVVLPYNEKESDMLDIYNALGRIEKIKDFTVPINGRDFYIFAETSRVQSAKNRRSISDPPPSNLLPFSETMYLCFKDAYLGNLYLRGDVSISIYGITYSMTNFADVRYLLLPVMKAERFSAVIYLEPIVEGILVYCMSGFYLPGFIAEKVNLTPNINRRITVFINWITDGLIRREAAE